MSNLPHPVITESAHLTLHHRLASEEGADIISTFADSPTTLQLGQGQLALFLEQCLIGLEEGVHRTFGLLPERAFGLRNPELLQRVSRATLDGYFGPDEEDAIGDLVEFVAPGGGQFAGVLRELETTIRRCSTSIIRWPAGCCGSKSGSSAIL